MIDEKIAGRYRVKNLEKGKDDGLEGAKSIPIYHNTKKCRSCSNKLELSRYYECIKCRPNLLEDTGVSYLSSREHIGFKISEMPLL